MCRRSEKGQIYVIDFILSVSIFMLLMVFAYSGWANSISNAGGDLENRQAYTASAQVLSSVIDYGGVPSVWAINASDPSASWLKGIGCASTQGVLDPVRLLAANTFFNSSTYRNDTKSKLGFGQFEGDIRVQRQDGSFAYVFGTPPNSSHVVLASESRVALLSEQPVWVRVRLWRPLYP